MSAYDTFIVYCLGMVCAVARMQLCCSDVHSSSGKDDLSRYYLLVTHRSHLRILQFKRRSWSFEYMHRLLFAGRSGFIQSRVLPLQSKVPSCTSSGGCIVRRASMSLYPTLDIKGQTVLITGASSGIGEACAWRFAEAGCKLILTARRTDRLDALSKQLSETYKVPIHTVTLDVQDHEKTQQFPAQLPKDFQEVDILLNNAGLALGTAKVHENSIENVRQMVDTNVTAVAILTKLFAAGMVERNRGHIINISSVAAHHAYPGGTIYSGTKHFIDAFTNSARHDLVGTDIRVTAISPGAVQTEFSKVRYSGDEDKAAAVYDGIIPLNGADVADNVLYAATRPAHVQIAEIIIYATYQSGPTSKANVIKKVAK